MARQAAATSYPQGVVQAKRLGLLLADTRRTVGWSQQDLAQQAGVSIGSVTKIESGRSPEPGFFLVARLAASLARGLTDAQRTLFRATLHAHFDDPPPVSAEGEP